MTPLLYLWELGKDKANSLQLVGLQDQEKIGTSRQTPLTGQEPIQEKYGGIMTMVAGRLAVCAAAARSWICPT